MKPDYCLIKYLLKILLPKIKWISIYQNLNNYKKQLKQNRKKCMPNFLKNNRQNSDLHNY